MSVFGDRVFKDVIKLVIKNPPANSGDARDAGSIPGLGRSPGERIGNSFQYSCLGNLMDRGAWWVTVHEVTEEFDTAERLNSSSNDPCLRSSCLDSHVCLFVSLSSTVLCVSITWMHHKFLVHTPAHGAWGG